jgi:hypothetical protein
MDINALPLPNLISWAGIVGGLFVIGTSIMGVIAFYKGKVGTEQFCCAIIFQCSN